MNVDKIIRMKCPDTRMDKEKRVETLFAEISKWIYSDYLKTLIKMFDGEIEMGPDLKDNINALNEFVNVWDYRQKQAKGGERWQIKDDDFVNQNADEIISMAEGLGLRNISMPEQCPDYVLPLGGARMANLARCQCAKTAVDLYQGYKLHVVALSGKRPINEIEKPFLDEYAPLAKTEYDAMNAGIEKAFGLEHPDYTETSFVTENINMQWAKREYATDNPDLTIHSIAAPSSDPARRANSFDTFDFFMEQYHIQPHTKVLLVTSCIYVPFQFLKFMQMALEKDIYVDCIGVPPAVSGAQFSLVSNYLQEIKGTVNAMKTLADIYLV